MSGERAGLSEFRTTAEYISDAEMLQNSGDMHGALALLEEGSVVHFYDRGILLEKARVHSAMGNQREAHETEVMAMNVLYYTKSEVKDSERGERTDPFERYRRQFLGAEPSP